MAVHHIRIVDSHTAGEPTRVVIDGGPSLSGSTMAERRLEVEADPDFWSGVINEPRGSDILVGALLTPPVSEDAVAGVVFFNNVGVLNMCGHGTIGVVETLRHLGRITHGSSVLDTSAGPVGFVLYEDGSVEFENVPCHRLVKDVVLDLPIYGRVTGDVAWGGNWFFLSPESTIPLTTAHLDELTAKSVAIRSELERQGIAGTDGPIDHIELTGPAHDPANSGRNFVLCPGLAYDRSPCGTGTSAKVAALAADGKLQPGEVWRQESILGTLFEASYRLVDGQVVPRVKGRAWITGEGDLLFADDDPLRAGLR